MCVIVCECVSVCVCNIYMKGLEQALDLNNSIQFEIVKKKTLDFLGQRKKMKLAVSSYIHIYG